jgi:hypothetical protein
MYEEYGRHNRVKVAEWVQAFKGKYSDAMNSDNENLVSTIGRIMDKKGRLSWDASDKQLDAEWARVKGIYGLKKNGSIKFVIDREKGGWK